MLSTNSSLKPTFPHFNGVSKSQIDYFLTNEQCALPKYSVGDMKPHNASSHIPERALLKTNYIFKNIQNSSSKQSVQSKNVYSWNLIDTGKYVLELESITPKSEIDNVEKSLDCSRRSLRKKCLPRPSN